MFWYAIIVKQKIPGFHDNYNENCLQTCQTINIPKLVIITDKHKLSQIT